MSSLAMKDSFILTAAHLSTSTMSARLKEMRSFCAIWSAYPSAASCWPKWNTPSTAYGGANNGTVPRTWTGSYFCGEHCYTQHNSCRIPKAPAGFAALLPTCTVCSKPHCSNWIHEFHFGVFISYSLGCNVLHSPSPVIYSFWWDTISPKHDLYNGIFRSCDHGLHFLCFIWPAQWLVRGYIFNFNNTWSTEGNFSHCR